MDKNKGPSIPNVSKGVEQQKHSDTAGGSELV